MAEEKDKIDEELNQEVDYKEETKEETQKKAKAKKSRHEVKIEKLEAEIQKLKEENKKEAEEFLKARADLDNIRKRLIDENVQNRKYASLQLVSDLVTPVDMLVKVSSMEAKTEEMNNFLIGFKMIANQINDVLEKDGLKEIKCLNQPFDPNYHQAMSKEKVEGVEPGIVIEVLQAGYMYKDRLLKPAMVKVSE